MQELVNNIIDHFYPEKEVPQLRSILVVHSESVARKALEICTKHPELNADKDIVFTGAMLHDIGIILCDAPGIQCYGKEPYINHGPLGAEMIQEYAEANGLTDDGRCMAWQRICSRHTGTGLPGHEPETIEETIVCYADKFFSKTRPECEKTYEQAIHSLEKFGERGVEIFKKWHKMFE